MTGVVGHVAGVPVEEVLTAVVPALGVTCTWVAARWRAARRHPAPAVGTGPSARTWAVDTTNVEER